jgi:hypothetical protein
MVTVHVLLKDRAKGAMHLAVLRRTPLAAAFKFLTTQRLDQPPQGSLTL